MGHDQAPCFRRDGETMDSMTGNELDALALEYQGDYGTAFRNVDISYLMNNPSANGLCRVFGLGLKEQSSNLLLVELIPTPREATSDLCAGGTGRQNWPHPRHPSTTPNVGVRTQPACAENWQTKTPRFRMGLQSSTCHAILWVSRPLRKPCLRVHPLAGLFHSADHNKVLRDSQDLSTRLRRKKVLMPNRRRHDDTSVSLHPLSFDEAIATLAHAPKRADSPAVEAGSTTSDDRASGPSMA